ncbi:hypothetical protein JXA32_12585 [Candidatus Sumerlaeota bacterium]|nr:hypothetical protein [Candidatus Sumerlaeota bacterium]
MSNMKETIVIMILLACICGTGFLYFILRPQLPPPQQIGVEEIIKNAMEKAKTSDTVRVYASVGEKEVFRTLIATPTPPPPTPEPPKPFPNIDAALQHWKFVGPDSETQAIFDINGDYVYLTVGQPYSAPIGGTNLVVILDSVNTENPACTIKAQANNEDEEWTQRKQFSF